MRINNNISALNAWRNLTGTDGYMSKSLERLSSGLRINRAADDAAGLAISEKMRGQIKGLNQAVRNAQDAISLIQTAEGALSESHSILQRMRELAVQAASDTSTDADRAQIQKEVDALAKELTRISNTSEFNTKNLLAGGFKSATFHIGANAGQNIQVSIDAMDAKTLGVAGSIRTATTTPGNTGLKGDAVSNVGSGFTANGTLTIDTVKTAASISDVQKASLQAGTVSATVTLSSYTGSTTQTVEIEVLSAADTADADGKLSITKFRYRINGGDWSATQNSVVSANGTAELKIGEATVTVTDTSGTATSDTLSFKLNPDKVDLTLLDSSGATLGDTVTVFRNQSKITLGDFASLKTVDVSFVVSALATSGAVDATVSVAVTDSTAATANNGAVVSEAVTYAGIAVNTQAAASKAIDTINAAITKVSNQRSALGAIQNRLEHTIANLSTAAENLSAAESRIRDVDMASEMVAFTRNQILLQAGTAMMAQANSKPQSVLQLLR